MKRSVKNRAAGHSEEKKRALYSTVLFKLDRSSPVHFSPSAYCPFGPMRKARKSKLVKDRYRDRLVIGLPVNYQQAGIFRAELCEGALIGISCTRRIQ